MFSSDEDHTATDLDGLRHKVRDLVAHCVDLDREVQPDVFFRRHIDKTIEDGFPVSITCEVIVGYKELAHALRIVSPDYLLHVISGAVPGLPALHVYDGAKAATEWTAA